MDTSGEEYFVIYEFGNFNNPILIIGRTDAEKFYNDLRESLDIVE